MAIQVFGAIPSPPTRKVLVTLSVLKMPFEWKKLKFLKGEHKQPEFLKLNPQHTIPVMKEGDLILNESRAIMTYLATKAGSEKLYPEDPKVRAMVDQRLYFDMGTFYRRLEDTTLPLMLFGQKEISKEKTMLLEEATAWTEDFVKPTGFVAGTEHMTVADLCLGVTYSQLLCCGHIDVSGMTYLNGWIKRVRDAIPDYHSACGEGEMLFAEHFKQVYAEANKSEK